MKLALLFDENGEWDDGGSLSSRLVLSFDVGKKLDDGGGSLLSNVAFSSGMCVYEKGDVGVGDSYEEDGDVEFGCDGGLSSSKWGSLLYNWDSYSSHIFASSASRVIVFE